jgi:hypothetical protein
VIGGLVTSSLLTLIVVPVVYTFFDDFGKKISGVLTRGEKSARRREDERAVHKGPGHKQVVIEDCMGPDEEITSG